MSTAQLVVLVWILSTHAGLSAVTDPLLVFGFALCVWRSLRIEVRAETDRLVIRNFWRSYTVAWTSVVHASFTALWPSPLTLLSLGRIVKLRTSDRRLPIGIHALLGRYSSKALAAFEAEARRHGVAVKPPS
jgi:hypothetical protein